MPVKLHPHDLLLQEFGATFPEDREECLEHLIQCPDCQNRLRRLLHSQPTDLVARVVPIERFKEVPADYDPVLDRLSKSLRRIQSAYARERAEAPGLFSELSAHPVEKRPLLVRNRPRFHTWGFCELLLRRSEERNFHDAAHGEDLAMLAVEVLDRLDPDRYGAEAIEDLRARAWAYVANSRRVKADLRAAEEAFALAFAALRRGALEPMDRALLLYFNASLLRAQRRFDKALSFLRRAARIFLDLGEKHQAGRVLISMSLVHLVAGEPERSIPVLYRALELIDPTRDPRLLLSVWHNLVYDLAEAGRFMEAQKLLARARPLYRQFPEPRLQNRLKWVEGKIARGFAQKKQAEFLLLAARDGFLAAKVPYEAALVSLELASLYAEQGRTAEIKRLAEEMMPIFSSRRIHREALAALAFWKQAVNAEKAGLDLVTEVASFLKRARHDPELRFERPETA
jgi:tetratricopeptide (TPR) repeat protein